jgi:hypothetical protein
MAMLNEAWQNDPSTLDRAICAAFLALGEWKLKNKTAALEWLQKARDTDPNCCALPRMEELVSRAEKVTQ